MCQFYRWHFPLATLKTEKAWPNTNMLFYHQWVTLFCFVDEFIEGTKVSLFILVMKRRKELRNRQRNNPGKIYREEKRCFPLFNCVSVCMSLKTKTKPKNHLCPNRTEHCKGHRLANDETTQVWTSKRGFLCVCCFYCEKNSCTGQKICNENTVSCF